ncbi:MAG TPA: hypothetical protein VEV43_01495 [Actinomycetota bacterium]|nr:hypothetical protein [Actinomycetota bacterium]
MHDEQLSIAIKDAGEAFEPPWADVRALSRRGRRRWWLTRVGAATTSLALAAGVAVATSRIDLDGGEKPPVRAAAPGTLRHWEALPAAPIAGRSGAAVAWTGSELLVVAGSADRENFDDGASFDPATDSWEKLPTGPSSEIHGAAVVWTGRELIFWGGEDGDDQPHRGAAYDPATRRWRTLPPAPSWSLGSHSAVWTGTEMLVWGGVWPGGPGPRGVAAAYDPATNEWEAFPLGPLGRRHGHAAVWTGEEMVVWGGGSDDVAPPRGPQAAAYDPETRTWRALPDSPLEPASSRVAFWTGKEVVLVGGLGAGPARDGAAYDPAADRWRSIAPVPLAAQRDDQPIMLSDFSTRPAWTGRKAVFVTIDGVLSYDPATDRWTRERAPQDVSRHGAAVAWTGDELLVWSGSHLGAKGYLETGWSGR